LVHDHLADPQVVINPLLNTVVFTDLGRLEAGAGDSQVGCMLAEFRYYRGGLLVSWLCRRRVEEELTLNLWSA
jgi:hypothetical protein